MMSLRMTRRTSSRPLSPTSSAATTCRRFNIPADYGQFEPVRNDDDDGTWRICGPDWDNSAAID